MSAERINPSQAKTLERRGWLWLASLLLTLPAAWPYVVHYQAEAPDLPAGFIMSDMPVYMAGAREHFDAKSITYGNPASPDYGTPAIYFQPATLLLGTFWRLTGLDPGVVLMMFGFMAGVVCVRTAIALYGRVVGLEGPAHWLGLGMFLWGGGVIALAGLADILLSGGTTASLFQFDAGGGWWFLNLGRNLIFPMEAFYHALFLGCVVALLADRFRIALLLAVLLSISHPFTGVQLLLILVTWCLVESFFLRSGVLPRWFVMGTVVLLAFHVIYYLLFLNLFEEHRAVVAQWRQPWGYQARHFIPAYLLVGGLALWRMRRLEMARGVLVTFPNRLFLVWFGVSFALANHEFAVEPVQPAHFTRGYVWTPLFLLGAPLLVTTVGAMLASRRRLIGLAMVVGLFGLFVSDNAAWFANLPERVGVYHTPAERDLVRWMDQPQHRGAVVLAQAPEIGYLAIVHTPLRAWHSHPYNTPHVAQRRREARAFFEDGAFLEDWRGQRLLIVYERDGPADPGGGLPDDVTYSIAYNSDAFVVLDVQSPPLMAAEPI